MDLLEASSKIIRARVSGTIDYHVLIEEKADSDNEVIISCTCPFFRQGYPCKHLWAAAVEADRKPKSIQGRDKTRHRAPGKKRKDKRIHWQGLFSDDFWNDGASSPWTHGPGSFILSYELVVTPLEISIWAFEQYIKKDGHPGRRIKPRPETLEHKDLPVQDRMIFAILDEAFRKNAHSYSYWHTASTDYRHISLTSRDLEALLPLLAETERCRVMGRESECVANPLRMGRPQEATIRFDSHELRQKGKKGIRLTPMILLGEGTEIAPKDLKVLFHTRPLMFVYHQRLYRLSGPRYSWLSSLMDADRIDVPIKDLPDLLTKIQEVEGMPEVKLPEKLAPKEITDAEPIPILRIDLDEGMVRGTLLMDYDGLEIEGDDRRSTILDPDKWIRITRNFEAERAHVESLERAGFSRQRDQVFSRDIKGAADALSGLTAAGFRIEARDKKTIRGGKATSFSISSGMDWFDLEGSIDFDGQAVPLPRAVRAYLRGERTIRLGDGSVGLLPEEWLSKNLALLELGKTVKGKRDKLRYPSSQALLLDSLLQENQVQSIDQRFLELKDALRNFEGIEKYPVPKDFVGKLRRYQEASLGWFRFLERFGFGGVLADDMGLGKTVQLLAWLAGHPGRRPGSPSLVIAPTTLIFNWLNEAARFTPKLRVTSYSGGDRHTLLEDVSKFDIILTTYGLLRRDITRLKDIEFNYVILDESQAIKNPDSQTAKAARLLNAAHRLCLTGTPLENHVGELWSQMEFLNPGLLGSKAVFERRFAKPISQNQKDAASILKDIVKPFILRRTKQMVAKDLPEKMEQIIRCPMTEEQAMIYRRIRDHYRSSLFNGSGKKSTGKAKFKILEGLLRLRQAANHPALVGQQDIASGKLIELVTLIDEAVSGGHKALVFSQFTKMLRLIRDVLEKRSITYEYLDGRTPMAKREAKVRNFQERDDISLFLISLKAGGVGLNLTAADYVFLVDPWWNPAVESQAVDRTHRIGQDKRVFTYRFITMDSVEEKVLALQEKKQELVSSILTGSKDMLRNLTASDLELLFS